MIPVNTFEGDRRRGKRGSPDFQRLSVSQRGAGFNANISPIVLSPWAPFWNNPPGGANLNKLTHSQRSTPAPLRRDLFEITFVFGYGSGQYTCIVLNTHLAINL